MLIGNDRLVNPSVKSIFDGCFLASPSHMPHALPVILPRLLQALESLDPSKYTIPEPFPYREARQLFKGKLHVLMSALMGGASYKGLGLWHSCRCGQVVVFACCCSHEQSAGECPLSPPQSQMCSEAMPSLPSSGARQTRVGCAGHR